GAEHHGDEDPLGQRAVAEEGEHEGGRLRGGRWGQYPDVGDEGKRRPASRRVGGAGGGFAQPRATHHWGRPPRWVPPALRKASGPAPPTLPDSRASKWGACPTRPPRPTTSSWPAR